MARPVKMGFRKETQIMPWTETEVMDQRTEFVLRVLRNAERFGEVCREFGISRKTGYKWRQRFLEEGLSGLGDQSRRPPAPTSRQDSSNLPFGAGSEILRRNANVARQGRGPGPIAAGCNRRSRPPGNRMHQSCQLRFSESKLDRVSEPVKD